MRAKQGIPPMSPDIERKQKQRKEDTNGAYEEWKHDCEEDSTDEETEENLTDEGTDLDLEETEATKKDAHTRHEANGSSRRHTQTRKTKPHKRHKTGHATIDATHRIRPEENRDDERDIATRPCARGPKRPREAKPRRGGKKKKRKKREGHG